MKMTLSTCFLASLSQRPWRQLEARKVNSYELVLFSFEATGSRPRQQTFLSYFTSRSLFLMLAADIAGSFSPLELAVVRVETVHSREVNARNTVPFRHATTLRSPAAFLKMSVVSF